MRQQECRNIRIRRAFRSVRKIARQLLRREDAYLGIDGYRILTLALITEEPKEAILAVYQLPYRDRPTHGHAELIAVQRGTRRVASWIGLVEKVIRVESVVPQVVVNASVEFIGAGFRDDVHNAAIAAAEFGGIIVGQNPEFGDGVGVWIHDGGAVRHGIVNAAVQL